MVERQKTCARCKTAKPWSQYHAKAKWSDGTMRQPHSRCKTCNLQARDGKRDWAAVVADPEKHAVARMRNRERWRRKHGTPPSRYRLNVTPEARVTDKMSAEPLAAWFRWIMVRDGMSEDATAASLDVADRVFRRILNGEQVNVELGTVERVLIADGTITLRELYPDLYREEAA